MAPSSPVPCAICGPSPTQVVAESDRSGQPLRTVICRTCGLVFSDPRPEADLEAYYANDYRREYKGQERPQPKRIYRNGWAALERLDFLRRFLPPGGRLLDAACGGGEFLYLAQSSGWQVEGIEPGRDFARYAREEYGVPILSGFIAEAAFPPAHFDAVTLWHALEHVDDPVGILERLGSWLAASGRLIVEVPNVLATCQAPRQRYHRAHLYHFNAVTLTAVGAKAGLAAIHNEVSADGGNLRVVFTRGQQAVSTAGNFAHTLAVLEAHTPWRHYWSAWPYRRLAGKIARTLRERAAIGEQTSGKRLLDALYQHGAPMKAGAEGR